MAIKSIFEETHEVIEFFGLNYRPGENVKFSAMELADEVVLLFVRDDLLELQAEPVVIRLAIKISGAQEVASLLFGDFVLVGVNYVLRATSKRRFRKKLTPLRTLIMMTRRDLNSDGLAEGSRTMADDWKDWNKPLMSLENAKLLRKRTYVSVMSKH